MTSPDHPPTEVPAARARSLTILYPALAAEWHPTRNGTLSPDATTPGVKRHVWWLCSKCQHEWQAQVASRTRGHGCPACARRARRKAHSAPKTGQSLAERFPTLAAEWHPTLNGDLTPSDVGYASNKKVWWQCQASHHEWQRQVCGRTQNGSGCPECKPDRERSSRKRELACRAVPYDRGGVAPHPQWRSHASRCQLLQKGKSMVAVRRLRP